MLDSFFFAARVRVFIDMDRKPSDGLRKNPDAGIDCSHLHSTSFIASAVYARIDTNLKDNAESILSQLGISPSSAIQMFYSQIVLKKGMPFELKLPSSKPLAVGAMTREQLDAELQKGVDSIKAGKVYSADEVDAALAKEFGI